MSTQSIAGVVPPSTAEATVMTVWPSVAATPVGAGTPREPVSGRLGVESPGALRVITRYV